MDGWERISRTEAGYPGALEICLGEEAPERLWWVGDLGLLDGPLVALLCSRVCTGTAATLTYDIVQRLRHTGCTVASGWQSPMEKESLRLLLKSPRPVVAGLARALPGARLGSDWRKAVSAGRMLVLSACPPEVKRVTADTAAARNLMLAALARRVFVAHAAPGGRTETLVKRLADGGKPVYCLAGTVLLAFPGQRRVDLSVPNGMNADLIYELTSGRVSL